MALQIKVGMGCKRLKRRPIVIRKQAQSPRDFGKFYNKNEGLGSQILHFNNPTKCKLST